LTLRAKDSSATAEEGTNGTGSKIRRKAEEFDGANAELAYFTNDYNPQNYST
jgi:hypothetical protein